MIFCWALYGIFNKPELVEGSPVAKIALIVMIVLAIGTLIAVINKRRRKISIG